MQGQVPAHIGVPDDKIRPQAAACRQAGRDRPQLTWHKAPGRGDQAAQHLTDGLLALGADTPAGLQPLPGLPSLLDARIARCASDSRHTTSLDQLPSYFLDRYDSGAKEGRPGRPTRMAAPARQPCPLGKHWTAGTSGCPGSVPCSLMG